MTQERIKEMYENWEAECSPADEEWRDDLTDAEAAIVEEWDERAQQSLAAMAAQILAIEARRRGGHNI